MKKLLNFLAILCLTVGVQAGETKPNVILLMADDMGWGSVGYNGNEIIQTPNLDQMAKEGIRFDRFYSASAVCSPTRASCLTGRNPFRTGVFNANNGILRPEEITLPELLKEQGYTTGHFGKWHLGTFSTEIDDANRGGTEHPELYNPPSEHGTDLYFATESKVPTCDPMLKPEKGATRFGWDYIQPGDATKPYGTHYWSNASGENKMVTDPLRGDDSKIIMDRALAFIEGAVKNDTPFLAVIWYHAPHEPCVAAPEFAEMYKDQKMEMRNYAGCITGLDATIGQLRKKLKELGVAENTMIWFCSDNGPENKTPGSTGPFSQRKRSLHEGGIRVPGLLVWPEKIKTGRVVDQACVTSDYLPTIMDVLDIPSSRVPYELDGESLLPLIEGKEFSRSQPLFFQYSGQLACSADQYKLYQKNGKPELYDLLADPSESNNLAATMPEKSKQMMAQWLVWQAATKASFEGAEYGTQSLDRVPQTWVDVTKGKKLKREF